MNNSDLPYHSDPHFGDPMPPLPDSNPNVRIGKDIVRSLLTCLDAMQEAMDVNILGKDRLEDILMAMREAREWLGEEPECDGGACHL